MEVNENVQPGQTVAVGTPLFVLSDFEPLLGRVHVPAKEFRRIEQEAAQPLLEAGFEPDYISIRRISDLAEPAPDDAPLVVLAAARLGRARLIDNLRI